ncbi:MAG: T9SS type A sorting domain-containing protein [Tannerellaceae bacterium]|jgi:hypothetical protein|nr:T9SS type A sorting domain-containing protein [Tannerellaceae bacterium]
MMKYLKSIVSLRKQLLLLSLMLLAGICLRAQDPVAPDTVYVSFAYSSAASMTYGQQIGDVNVGGTPFNLNSFTFQWRNAEDAALFTLNNAAQIAFQEGKTVYDLLMLSPETPTVAGPNNVAFNLDAFKDVLIIKDNNSQVVSPDDYVYALSPIDNTVTARALTVSPAELYIAPKDTFRLYGDPNPGTEWAVEDFFFAGFVNGETQAIFDGTTNVLPTVRYANSAALDAAAGSKHLIRQSEAGSAANYTITFVSNATSVTASGLNRGYLNILQSPLSLALPDTFRLYDRDNIEEIHVARISITDGELKNGELLPTLFEDETVLLQVTPTARDWNPGPKSDVGTYAYSLSDETYFRDQLSNYDLTFTNEAVYEILQDTVTLKVWTTLDDVTGFYPMFKVYGEENPAGRFYVTKETAPGDSPSFYFDETDAEYLKTTFFTAENEAESGFLTAPVIGYFDYENDPVTIRTEVNLKKTDGLSDSLYLAKVTNEPTSKNYYIKLEEGDFRIGQRSLAFESVAIYREYGEFAQDTIWHLEANNADERRGLASFDNQYRQTGKPYEVIDTIPWIYVDKRGRDNSLHAGIHADTLTIKILAENGLTSQQQYDPIDPFNPVDPWIAANPYKPIIPLFQAKDRNYKLELGLVLPNLEAQDNDSVSLNVSKAPLTIALDTIRRAYGSPDPDFNAIAIQEEFIAYSGFKLEENAANLGQNRIQGLSISGRSQLPAILPVGVYPLGGVGSGNETSRNYEITITGAPYYEIIPADSYRIVWDPTIKRLIVGDKVKLDAGVWQGNELVDFSFWQSDIHYTSSNDKQIRVEKVDNEWWIQALGLTSADGVEITATYSPKSGYAPVSKTIVYTVERLKNEADFYVTIGSTTFTYDGQPKQVDVTLTDPLGLRTYTPVITYNGDYDLPVDAGDYNLAIYAQANGTNILVRQEMMRINPGIVTVTPNDLISVYGYIPTKEDLRYTVKGFIGNDGFTISNQPSLYVAGPIAKAGAYIIYATGPERIGNYAITYNTGKLSVTKKTLYIRAQSKTITYGEALPEYNPPLFDGLVGGDTPANLNFIYTVKLNGYTGNAGAYSLTIETLGTTEESYLVELIPGTLTVNKAPSNLVWIPEKTTVVNGEKLILTATSDSPGEIVFESKDNSIILVEKVNGQYVLTGKAVGSTDIYATQAGGVNYQTTRIAIRFNVAAGLTALEELGKTSVSLTPTVVESYAVLTSAQAVKELIVVDLTGKVQMLIRPENDRIDLHTLTRGIYFVKVILDDNTSKVIRIVKR